MGGEDGMEVEKDQENQSENRSVREINPIP